MMPDFSEKHFEATIEWSLLAGGPDALPSSPGTVAEGTVEGFFIPGGYHKRAQADKTLCLIPRDLLAFIYATQPKEWDKFQKIVGTDAKDRLLKRVASEVEKRGALDVLRKGVKSDGCKFQLAYFRPASGLNEALEKLYRANLFSLVRQLHYSQKNNNSLDCAIMLNGLPIFSAALKNPLNGQNVQHAIQQYRFDRDPKEPLFAFGRSLAHLPVDPDLAYVTTTHLRGAKTRFLPFNQGRDGGAGNPPSWRGFATAYLWEQVWARDSILELIQLFCQVVEEEDDKGHKTGERTLIFPRYHQLDAVRRLVRDAKEHGPGQSYLIQHSAGSGKSNSIAWLAHQLSVLHDARDCRVFDSIIVITDRRVLDRQLQRTVSQFQQVDGVVENIDKTSAQLKAASEADRENFRGILADFVRLYAFLSQILPFADVDLEKLYVFGRLLLRRLPKTESQLPLEVQQQVDMDSYRVQKTGSGKIGLRRGRGELEPRVAKPGYTAAADPIEPLSAIIQELNEQFGTSFDPEDRVFIQLLEEKLAADPALAASVEVKPPESARLTFEHVAQDQVEDMIDTNFRFYKQIRDDREFAAMLFDALFERYLKARGL